MRFIAPGGRACPRDDDGWFGDWAAVASRAADHQTRLKKNIEWLEQQLEHTDAAARRFGDKPVVIATDRTLTFAQLDRLSMQLALQLRAQGVVPGDVTRIDQLTAWSDGAATF